MWDNEEEEEEETLCYEERLPKRAKLSTKKKGDGNWRQDEKNWRRTINFYSCLGFRLGLTVRQLAKQHKINERKKRKDSTSFALSVNHVEVSKDPPGQNSIPQHDML